MSDVDRAHFPHFLPQLGHSAPGPHVPATFADAGDRAAKRYVEFFTAEIRNPNTREAYGRAVLQFDRWCQSIGLTLAAIAPVHVAGYVEHIG
jgi:integrase/recombinase XerD